MPRTVEATATKHGGWWTVAIPELDQSAATKRRGEVQEHAERLAAAALDADPAELDVTVAYPLPENVRGEWEAARADQARAQELTAQATTRTRAVVATLHADGYTVRDIAAVLGVSFQRVGQLLNPKPDQQTDNTD